MYPRPSKVKDFLKIHHDTVGQLYTMGTTKNQLPAMAEAVTTRFDFSELLHRGFEHSGLRQPEYLRPICKFQD